MLADRDDDIDALMSSVLGRDGTPAVFPARPERTSEPRPHAQPQTLVESPAQAGNVIELSAQLRAELARNEVIDPRNVPVRFSNLKHIARSPLHYWDAVQVGREDTLAMRLGRGGHAMVLGMPVIQWPGKTRNGKKWDRFRTSHADKEILNRSEWAKAEGIATAIRRHPIAAPLLFDGTVLEQLVEWTWIGRACTSRPDSRRIDWSVITDLKTTQCAEPERFSRDAMYRGYNGQLAFYDLAGEHTSGRQADDLYVVAVESKRPYAVTVLRVTDEAREQGRKLCRLWMERLLVCEQSNHWPAYVDHIAELAVSDGGELKLTIDGDEFNFDGDDAAP